jgi:hypothetical protein
LNVLAKLKPETLVQRGLSPREMLQSSKEFIKNTFGHPITEKHMKINSVWIAQREGLELKTEMMLQIQVFKMLCNGV